MCRQQHGSARSDSSGVWRWSRAALWWSEGTSCDSSEPIPALGREAAAGLDPTEPAEGTARALCPGRLCETWDPCAYQRCRLGVNGGAGLPTTRPRQRCVYFDTTRRIGE